MVSQPQIFPEKACGVESHFPQTNTWRQNHQWGAPNLDSLSDLGFLTHMLNTLWGSKHGETVTEDSRKRICLQDEYYKRITKKKNNDDNQNHVKVSEIK